MQKQITQFLSKVYFTTMLLGLLVGGAVLYLKDVHQGTYNNEWDNPFWDFILFLLIGIGESLIPVLAFYVLIKGILYTRLPFPKYFIYLVGLACTIVPFITIYNMVNEGYHRDNVAIYCVCFVFSLILSFVFYRADLNALTVVTKSSGE